MEKTIAAIATAPGVGGIAVIRVSGPEAVKIADRVFRGKKKLAQCPSHTVHHGRIIDKAGAPVDEVLATVMLAPRTFTGEDTVEISTHGGTNIPRRVLECLLYAGASQAGPGEFTKRAFLNGKLDLSQAEAVIDLINSENELAGKTAFSQLEGVLSERIRGLRGRLVSLAARMQVAIDYPDEDLEDITPAQILSEVTDTRKAVAELLATSDNGRMIKEGVAVTIVGKPNVGKSSLLNCLVREERAIVTSIAGTTRDIIEEYVWLDSVPVRLIDTAGIRDTDDVVEKLGVERSEKAIDNADLVLVMLDGSMVPDDDDRRVLKATRGKERIIIINKTDLGGVKYAEAIRAKADKSPVVEISAKTGSGLRELEMLISSRYKIGALAGGNNVVITNSRHKAALERAESALLRAEDTLHNGLPQDLASIDIAQAMDELGEITGETVSEDVVAEIFKNFCVGK